MIIKIMKIIAKHFIFIVKSTFFTFNLTTIQSLLRSKTFMKTAITIIFTFFLTMVYGQTDNYKALLDSAKTFFKREDNLNQAELEKFDYSQIASMLETVVKSNPENAEARYFLGCAYSRMNSKDGQSILNMDIELVKKASEQFEKVIKLTPKYTGEIVNIDPYSKLTSEWGSMGMSYWYNNKDDSAIWAFKEGKTRGGFSDFILGVNRNVLDACSEGAILISSGDNFTIPFWYLQTVEKYRPDVAVVDINLLNTKWYPAFLSNVAFDISNKELNTLDYIEWTDSVVTINNFSWTVKPSFDDKYLLRGDRVFLSLLKANEFHRDLYFVNGLTDNQILGLEEYLSPFIIVNKLSISDKDLQPFEDYKRSISQLLSLSKLLNLNSSDEQRLFDYYIRLDLLNKVSGYLNDNEKEKAKELMDLLDKFADDTKYPFYSDELKEYEDHLRQNI